MRTSICLQLQLVLVLWAGWVSVSDVLAAEDSYSAAELKAIQAVTSTAPDLKKRLRIYFF